MLPILNTNKIIHIVEWIIQEKTVLVPGLSARESVTV